MLKQTTSLRNAAITVIAAASLSLPMMSVAAAQHRAASGTSTVTQCKIVGAISHRCYTFHSDATWPAGLSDYHGSNGG